jgi:hypothetical protein
MAKRIAIVSGTALVPGVSKNGRYYSKSAIAKAVARAQGRISEGTLPLVDRREQPLSQRTHHAAGDDSSLICGRITSLTLADDGSAKFTADLANTSKARDIAALADTSDGKPAFLRGVSIRGAWASEPKTVVIDGQPAEGADDLILHGLDYTGDPGVPGAVIDSCVPVDESASLDPTLIFESVQEATVAFAITDTAPEAHVSLPSPDDAALAEAKVPMSKRDSGLSGSGGPWADPGYQADKKQRYQLDSKQNAKSAWAFINQKDNASKYTANQLKRVKQRIVKALKKFGVEVNTAEHYLIEPAQELSESTTIAECMAYDDCGDSRGSFYVTLTNGPVSVSVSSFRVDPADLDLIGRAAMDGACKALATIDPDMDGDMDVPGASAEDTDHDMDDGEDDEQPSANVPGTPCPCGCGCAIPVAVTGCPCACGNCDVCGSSATTGEAAPEPAASVAEATDPDPAPAEPADSIPAPEPAAETITETEERAVSEPITAVEPTQAAAPTAVPAAPTFTFEQMMALLGAAGRPVEAAPAPAAQVAEAAPAAPAPAPAPVVEPQAAAPAAPVVESQEAMIARLVAEGVANAQRAFIQDLAESGALAGRKGLTAQAPGSQAAAPVAEGTNSYGMPAGAPDKPLHEYSTEEFNRWCGPVVFEHAVGHYAGRRGQ